MNTAEHWKNLSKRQQLRNAVGAYAALTGRDMRTSWFRLERILSKRTGVDLTTERKAIAAQRGSLPTIELWIETKGLVEQAIALALTMEKSC